jgi:hypothetical protein
MMYKKLPSKITNCHSLKLVRMNQVSAIDVLKTNMNLNCTYNFILDHAVNKFHHGYKTGKVQGNNLCMFRDPHKPHKCTLRAEYTGLDEFAKLQIALNIQPPPCLFVRPHGRNQLPLAEV